MAAYLRIAPAPGSIEVGHINFSPLLQRTPAATEAMYLMMRQAFELGYRRYEWKCDCAQRAVAGGGASGWGCRSRASSARRWSTRAATATTAWYATIDKEWPALKPRSSEWLSPENFDATAGNAAAVRAHAQAIAVRVSSSSYELTVASVNLSVGTGNW